VRPHWSRRIPLCSFSYTKLYFQFNLLSSPAIYDTSMQSFDAWNELKKKIDSGENYPEKFPKQGEVWMGNIGRNIGFEQNGSGNDFSRPVLIVKKFNNRMFWAMPLSTKQKDIDFYFNYTDPNDQKVSAILAQMKLVSVKRLRRKLYDVDDNLFDEIKQKLKAFL
jgi:mRNA interferase MazF